MHCYGTMRGGKTQIRGVRKDAATAASETAESLESPAVYLNCVAQKVLFTLGVWNDTRFRYYRTNQEI